MFLKKETLFPAHVRGRSNSDFGYNYNFDYNFQQCNQSLRYDHKRRQPVPFAEQSSQYATVILVLTYFRGVALRDHIQINAGQETIRGDDHTVRSKFSQSSSSFLLEFEIQHVLCENNSKHWIICHICVVVKLLFF